MLLATGVNKSAGKCECPAGKSALGVTPSKDVKCVDCPANSGPFDNSKNCACLNGFEPAWTKATTATKACKVKILTN